MNQCFDSNRSRILYDCRNNIGGDKEPVQQNDVVYHFKTEERVWKMVQRIKLEKRTLNLTFCWKIQNLLFQLLSFLHIML